MKKVLGASVVVAGVVVALLKRLDLGVVVVALGVWIYRYPDWLASSRKVKSTDGLTRQEPETPAKVQEKLDTSPEIGNTDFPVPGSAESVPINPVLNPNPASGDIAVAGKNQSRDGLFPRRYKGMTNDELLQLATQKDSLLDAARRALDFEMHKRGLGEPSVAVYQSDSEGLRGHENSMFCTHCGANLSESAIFCTKCGNLVAGAKAKTKIGKQENAPRNYSTRPNRIALRKLAREAVIFMVAGSLLGALALVYAVLYLDPPQERSVGEWLLMVGWGLICGGPVGFVVWIVYRAVRFAVKG